MDSRFAKLIQQLICDAFGGLAIMGRWSAH